jgi:hypothetical protein
MYSKVLHRFQDFVKHGNTLLTHEHPERLVPFNTDANYLIGNTWLHENIAANIKQTMKTEFKYQYTFDDVAIDLTIIYDKYDEKRTKYLLMILNLIIYILNGFKKDKIGKVKIVLIHCALKKIKPKNGISLTSYHVNSGVSDGEQVIVYRSEEMTKVLIHELVHFYGFDHHFEINANINIEHSLNKLFNFNANCKSILMYEAYTDTFACLLNIMLYTILESKESKESKEYIKNLVKERKYILKQGSNILDHLGYSKNLKTKSAYCETTNVMSYYVVKAILFADIDKFIEYLENHNYHLENATEFIELIHNNLAKFLEIIKTEKQNLNTLRMSNLDIKN